MFSKYISVSETTSGKVNGRYNFCMVRDFNTFLVFGGYQYNGPSSLQSESLGGLTITELEF